MAQIFYDANGSGELKTLKSDAVCSDATGDMHVVPSGEAYFQSWDAQSCTHLGKTCPKCRFTCSGWQAPPPAPKSVSYIDCSGLRWSGCCTLRLFMLCGIVAFVARQVIGVTCGG